MALIPPAKKGFIELTGLQGRKVQLRPALIVSITAGPPSSVEMLGGSRMLVQETPGQIAELIAQGGRKLLAGASSYAKLKDALEEDELQAFLTGDDGKALWIEALKEVAYGRHRSYFSRLLGIYGEVLSPFSFVKGFTGGSDRPSPLEAEMLAKGYLRAKPSRGGDHA